MFQNEFNDLLWHIVINSYHEELGGSDLTSHLTAITSGDMFPRLVLEHLAPGRHSGGGELPTYSTMQLSTDLIFESMTYSFTLIHNHHRLPDLHGQVALPHQSSDNSITLCL